MAYRDIVKKSALNIISKAQTAVKVDPRLFFIEWSIIDPLEELVTALDQIDDWLVNNHEHVLGVVDEHRPCLLDTETPSDVKVAIRRFNRIYN